MISRDIVDCLLILTSEKDLLLIGTKKGFFSGEQEIGFGREHLNSET